MAVGEYYTAEKGGADDVERGQQGERTKAAQDALVRIGLLEEASGANKGRDGKFGPKTEAAIRAFQKQQGLEVTGRLDKGTEKALTDTAPEGDPPGGRLAPGKAPGKAPAKGAPLSPKTRARLAAMTPAERDAVIKRARALVAEQRKRSVPERA